MQRKGQSSSNEGGDNEGLKKFVEQPGVQNADSFIYSLRSARGMSEASLDSDSSYSLTTTTTTTMAMTTAAANHYGEASESSSSSGAIKFSGLDISEGKVKESAAATTSLSNPPVPPSSPASVAVSASPALALTPVPKASPTRSGEAASKRGAKKKISDFWMGHLLGEGAYARVHYCALKSSGECYAMKIMEKRFIIKEKKVDFVNMEKRVLQTVSHPNLMRLYYSFHDAKHLYMVMDVCRGGELLKLIHYHIEMNSQGTSSSFRGACPVTDARFYVAEIVCAIQYLHSLGIIHRDLKPENVLLTSTGHVKVTDFGTAKDEKEEKGKKRRNTFCGTAEYVSPEVLQDKDASIGADLWGLGCLVYQLLLGTTPFKAESEYLTFQRILRHAGDEAAEHVAAACEDQDDDEAGGKSSKKCSSSELNFPQGCAAWMGPESIDLVKNLLAPEPSSRLGASKAESDGNGPHALRAHPFFKGIEFEGLHAAEAPPLPYTCNLPTPKMDGASRDWMFAGDATELHDSPNRDSEASRAEPLEVFSQEGGQHRLVTSSSTSSCAGNEPRNVHMHNALQEFLEKDENILYDGLVMKRRGLFSHTRHLILTNQPRLLYIDPTRMVFKGQIPFSLEPSELVVKVKINNKTFDVQTPNRTYHLTDLMGNAKGWADAIKGEQDAARRRAMAMRKTAEL